MEATSGVSEKLDALYEFERAPVTEDRLQPPVYFAGLFAGEHVAATEFVIGALLVSFGTSARDIVLGLLLGNLLAVLSWTFICAPIAVQTRLTLYWYLRRVAGPGVTILYNLLNAIMYCILAGAMITVSASAVRLPFGIPAQTRWYPEDARFVLVVLTVGAVVVTLALAAFAGARETLPQEATPPAEAQSLPRRIEPMGPRGLGWFLSGAVALGALAACVALPVWMFTLPAAAHDASGEAFKTLLLVATLVYFVSGVAWMGESEKRRRPAVE